jgi:hypothetical protein
LTMQFVIYIIQIIFRVVRTFDNGIYAVFL